MMTLTFAFWLFMFIFATIGAMRGWAKELMVTFSMILALFIMAVVEKWVPFASEFFKPPNGTLEFWVRSILIIILVFFGYQTPNLPKFSGTRFARERISDSLLGFFIGALNGFLIVGALWFYLDQSQYPYANMISPPDPKTPMGQAALRMLPYLVPHWLGVPAIFFALAVACIFVVVVFI
jgi:uncharacterized membrane protein required for colicin V production